MTHIIYIPGLGDRYDGFRRACLSWWKLLGVSVEHVPITWYDGGSFEQKMELIAAAIEGANGKRIVLIGESAGASLVLHAGVRHPNVSRIITLCGVAQASAPVSQYLRRRAPALDTAVNTLPDTSELDVHSVRATVDGVVGKASSTANGATPHVLWSVGHLTTIALCLAAFAPIITGIAKSPKK